VAPVRILLTFDDGPHDGALGGNNRTEKVLDALKHKRARAVFFIQTHAPSRLASPNGSMIASRIHAEGHVLAVHSGSFVDHRCHKWRCAQPADIIGATNGLDSDMIRAKAAIKKIVGTDPKFVRATYGYTDAKCMEVYSQNRLKHVYWDLVSSDDSRTATAASVQAHLVAEMKRLARGAVDLICLLHDINRVTAEHIVEFIDAIDSSVRTIGQTPIFVADRLEAELVMDRKSGPGTDTPCPADSMD
jgi:peptidoglycan/xylan/chitin deacetylase (PgdA/CDA1 family)